MAHLPAVLNAKKSPDQAGLVVGEGRAGYWKPTRSSICCTLVVFAPTALIGMVSLLKGLPPVMALRAGLSSATPLAAGHSLLPFAK